MHRGYVKLWRKFHDTQFWRERRVFSRWEAWEDLFVSANHEDHQVAIGTETFVCKRGECMRSMRDLALDWKWSEHRCSNFLSLCSDLGMIEVLKTTRKTTHIRICNYEIYQSEGSSKGIQKELEGVSKGDQTAAHRDTNKKKRIKELIPPISPLKSQKSEKTWRTSFWEYRRLVIIAYRDLLNDKAALAQQQEINPSLDIKLSIKKAVVNFWGTKTGWKYKTKGKSEEINMRQTLINSIDKNRVYPPRQPGAAAEPQPAPESRHAMYRVIG